MAKTITGWHPLQLRFAPTGRRASVSFSLEGTPRAGEGVDLPGAPLSVEWTVSLDPDSRPLSLSSGEKLPELEGQVAVYLGDDGPEGRLAPGREGMGAIWGVVFYQESPRRYHIRMWVSRAVLNRLVSLVERGNLPTLDVWLADPDKIDGQWVESRRYEWDLKKQPELEIVWCRFSADMADDFHGPHPGRRDQTPMRSRYQRLGVELDAIGRRLRTVAGLLVVAVILLGVLVARRL